MKTKAFLFDLDGTLIDANETHARAWKDTMDEFGYTDVSRERIALEIGKGGDKLVPTLLGDVPEARSKALRERHDERFRELVDKEGIQAFPKIEPLFEAIHERGLQIAIATASQKENLERVAKAAGLDLQKLADEIVTDTDVRNSKPDPDTVQAAVKKLKLDPGECVMVGDTIYDVETSARAGVACIGVLTGIWTAPDLERAGAVATYRDTADLLDHLDEALEKVERRD